MPTNAINEQQITLETNNHRLERILGTRDIPNDFVIDEAVITILDKGGDEPVLNEYTLDLNETIYSFLYKHLEKCFRSDRLKFGKFNPQVNTIKDLSLELLRNEKDIIETSKSLSNILFNIMKNNDGIESCDLITMNLTTNLGSMVAIIKLDYANNFIHNVDFLEEKISIGITPVKTGLPCHNLQKAAIIKGSEENGFELYYLDELRKSKDSGEYNVQYWCENFLNCTEVTNSKSSTIDFKKATEDWIRVNRFDSVKTSEEIRSTIREKMLEEDNISISELASNIFNNDTEKAESFKEYMSSLNFEDEVKVDKPTAIKKLSKIKIKIDKSTTLTIDREVYNNLEKFEVTENNDGSINMTLKNITSYVEK